jgi:hypothetical protein
MIKYYNNSKLQHNNCLRHQIVSMIITIIKYLMAHLVVYLSYNNNNNQVISSVISNNNNNDAQNADMKTSHSFKGYVQYLF